MDFHRSGRVDPSVTLPTILSRGSPAGPGPAPPSRESSGGGAPASLDSEPPPTAYELSPGADGSGRSRRPPWNDHPVDEDDFADRVAAARAKAPGFLGKMSGAELLRLMVHAGEHLAARRPGKYPDLNAVFAAASRLGQRLAAAEGEERARAERWRAEREADKERQRLERLAWEQAERRERDRVLAERERAERVRRELERPRPSDPYPYSLPVIPDPSYLLRPATTSAAGGHRGGAGGNRAPTAPAGPASPHGGDDFGDRPVSRVGRGRVAFSPELGAEPSDASLHEGGDVAGAGPSGDGLGPSVEGTAPYLADPVGASEDGAGASGDADGAADPAGDSGSGADGEGSAGPRPPGPRVHIGFDFEGDIDHLPVDDSHGPLGDRSPSGAPRAKTTEDIDAPKPRKKLHRPRKSPSGSKLGKTSSPSPRSAVKASLSATFPGRSGAGAGGGSGSPRTGSPGPPLRAESSASGLRPEVSVEDSRLTVMSDASFLLTPAAADRKPWRVKETDTALLSWIEDRAWRVREREHMKNQVMSGDLDFLSNLANRMRKRNLNLEKMEQVKANEAAARIQKVWLARSLSKSVLIGANGKDAPGASTAMGASKPGLGGKPGRTWEQVASDAHTTKFLTFCSLEDPPLPSIPTLPLVIVRYADFLNEEMQLNNPKQLEHYFESINEMHREAKYDEPAVDMIAKVAYMHAVRKKTDIVRSPVERRSPLHPRFVIRMIELAIFSTDERVKRACTFTALSYQCFGNRTIFAAMPLNYFRLDDESGAVSVHDREASAATAPMLLIPYREWQAGGAGGAQSMRESMEDVASSGGATSFRPVSPRKREVSFRALLNSMINAQHARGLSPLDPAFYLPSIDRFKPTANDEAVWVGEALKASHAYPPGGERWNLYSLKSGAASAAFSVGVQEGRIARIMGLSSDREDKKLLERTIDALLEPTRACDFFFWHYRTGAIALTEQQMEFLKDDTKKETGKGRS